MMASLISASKASTLLSVTRLRMYVLVLACTLVDGRGDGKSCQRRTSTWVSKVSEGRRLVDEKDHSMSSSIPGEYRVGEELGEAPRSPVNLDAAQFTHARPTELKGDSQCWHLLLARHQC